VHREDEKMKVRIKDFAVTMDMGNDGITMDVYDPGVDGAHRGDVRFGKATIEWCPGRTRTGNGHKVNWNDFIAWMETKERG
jgi:hypothetical protein